MDTAPDNASLLTNACALLERSRAELQQLEIEMEGLKARHYALTEVVEALVGKPRARRGRPVKPTPEQQPQDDAASIDAFADAVA